MRSRRQLVWPKLSTAVLLLCAACACAETSGSQKNAPEPPRKPIEGAELFAGYKSWARVNPQPAVFHLRRVTDCALPTTETEARLDGAGNPHLEKFINVFVNDAGRRAMLEEKRPRFPSGSLVVKEKLAARDSAEPELLTAMLKREAGYDPEGGDWEYMVLDGKGQEVKARGKLESCRACHQAVADTDFVSRNYLPPDLRRKLK